MTNKQYRLLKYLYKSSRNTKWIKRKFHLNEDELMELIYGDDDFDHYYEYRGSSDNIELEINNTGKAYVDTRKTGNIKFWIPIIIDSILSISAIIISIFALLK